MDLERDKGTSAVVVRQCAFAQMATEANFAELIAEYAVECGMSGLPPPRMNPEMYRLMEEAGILTTHCAYVDETLVGFVLVLVVMLPHYSVLVANTESFFVARDRRPTGAGSLLLRAAEDAARQRGAMGLLVSAPTGGQLAEVLSRKREYNETNRVFFRGLACH